jgi:hypothetical protein
MAPQSGYCDRCEASSDNLKELNAAKTFAIECRIELEQEK